MEKFGTGYAPKLFEVTVILDKTGAFKTILYLVMLINIYPYFTRSFSGLVKFGMTYLNLVLQVSGELRRNRLREGNILVTGVLTAITFT